MLRNFTIILYFVCLLTAMVYPANQRLVEPATLSVHSTVMQERYERGSITPVEDIGDFISLPEAPATEVYVPNSIKDFKTAGPAEGISLISAPVANNSGNAVLNFTMKIPAGRQGLQPSLAVQYNNEGGTTWMGYGWNYQTPSIGIETRWGAPRYDVAMETEMYTLNGESLAPVNNRAALVARAAEKQFYPRVEGSFNKIIRHGNSPSNYWWEVTDKMGVRNFFGGTPGIGVAEDAVLKDELGNIAYWALVETRDPGDNYVKYIYQNVQDAGVANGTVPGQQLYISEIVYTGHGTTDGPYRVAFIRDRQLGESRRKDVIIDARLGFKMVSADLLRMVRISLNSAVIRSYEFTYETGAFHRSLLKSISELDDANEIFYTHDFDYYDDVNKDDYNPATAINDWSIGNDNIQGDIHNPIPGFTGEGSALSTAKANSTNVSVAVTVGSVTGGTWSKNTTLGGGFNYSLDYQDGLVSMIDINGDGLPDKVFKLGVNLYYRANLGGASRSFGERRPITGIHAFSASESENIGGGGQIIPPVGFFGYNITRTTTKTKIYFSDFNGDGLMDIAAGGQVYFNHLNGQGDPEFVNNSTLTPSPIFTGSIDGAFLAKDTAKQLQQELDFPLQDIVRMWEAPHSGIINIDAPVRLVEIVTPGVVNTKKDGVRASIQIGNIVIDTVLIPAGDHSVKPITISNRNITKGQRIYFRLQSRYNGEDDLVEWDPVIQYTTPVEQCSDGHHKTSNYYRASEDFILHSKGTIGMGKAGAIIIDGTFKKDITSDSVWAVVTRKRNNVLSTLFERAFGNNELFDDSLKMPGQLAVDTSDEFYFSLVSRSYIDRSVIEWQPHFEYVSFTDATPVTGNNGKPTMQGFPVPDNSNFNNWHYTAPPVTTAVQDTVTLWPQVAGGGNGTLWFTIKGTDTVYARRRIFITGGVMNTAMDSVRMVRRANEPLFMEFATDSLSFAQGLVQPNVLVYRDSSFLRAGLPVDTAVIFDTVPSNLYANPGEDFLGTFYRGWGHFSFKGSLGDAALQESAMNLDELNSYPTDPNLFTDSASMGGVPDPSKTNFIMLFPNAGKDHWVGYDSSVFVQGAYMSSSRLWLHDVFVDSLMVGEGTGAATKISTTITDSYSLGVTPGVVASGGTSFANTRVNLDMMDMNGDRYPDVLNEERIQYSLPNGGLGPTVIYQAVNSTRNDGFSYGVSLGGNFIEASTENTTKKGAVAAQKTAKNSSGLSGSLNSNDDESIRTWIDINGDGLMDRVYSNDTVFLNLGYRFAAPEKWGLEAIDRSNSIAAGAGLGVNIDAGSIEAGIGLSRTTANNNFLLADVNGDGLPDQLRTNENYDLRVRLNTGSGFDTATSWKAFNAITTNISTGESVNAAYSITIPILFVKIVVNPGVNVGHGVSRQEKTIMDIDGDGYPDLLTSNNDGHLTASGSTIGRTNMLSKVSGPLGGYFSLDYDRVGNTYEMPMSKWVMKSVEICDGVAGDGVDTMRRRFSYEEGYMDRHERDFYGFRRVISTDLNTAANNVVYRHHIQQFLNTSYYNKGLLVSDWVEDAGGNKYTQTNYLYDIDTLHNHVLWPALVQTEKLFYEGATSNPLSTVKEFEYDAIGNITRIADAGDGTQQDMLFTEIAWHDINNLYIKAIPSRIEQTTAEGVKRRTDITINNTGNITRLRQFLANGTYADTDMEYDAYSNLSRITRPANYKNQRMWHQYEYDEVTHSYITSVSDAFGYTSTSTYDYRFGALTRTVSMHDEPMQYTWDNHGRLTGVTGPYELAAGKPYTIAFEYGVTPGASYAVTRHHDPEHNADINTVSFSDGLGRVVQVKKQVALFKGKGAEDELKMVVSGSDLFDAFGRVAHSYYPITEPMGILNTVLNTGTGEFKSSTTYDVQDRALTTVLADGATTATTYTIDNGLFSEMTTDALDNRREIRRDVRNRKRFVNEFGPDGTITTRYDYNPLNELLKVVDNNGNEFVSVYDNLGRRSGEQHPDAGLTEYTYDLSGNLLKKITAQIRKEIDSGGAIQYQYDYDRVTDIDYPRQYHNKVTYTYGAPGTGSKSGRMILQMDASGGEEYFYGKMGEVIKTIRTVMVSPSFATTYVTEHEYDSWNRLKKLSYPDGEVVQYGYNRAGKLLSVEGAKTGHVYKYVDQLGYDEYEDRVYMLYGNGAETKYTYDNQRRRLTRLQAGTEAGHEMMNYQYTYDAVNNITLIENNVTAQSGKPGGYSKHSYQYDNLYRLDSASGEYNGAGASATYGLKVAYDKLNNIVRKSLQGTNGYDHFYIYEGAGPHQPSQIGERLYSYDDNGNQGSYGDVENFWDEENRLMAVLNNGVLSRYTYDADGQRVIRSSGGIQGVWLNGAPAGAVEHNENYTVYVNPFISCQQFGFVKHIYIENQRIATKQGHGTFTNINFPQPGLTAGGVDYARRAALMEKHRQEYYASLGVSPGPPTDKNYWARPENSGIPAPVFVDSTATSIPQGWPGNTTPPPDGPPVFVNPIPSNDSVKAGYGFKEAGHLFESGQYFFHTDHLGSTNYVTNTLGDACQHFEYSPFGETFYEEVASSYVTPYLYTGKGKDAETGYYFYGARYYEPLSGLWLTVDQSRDPGAGLYSQKPVRDRQESVAGGGMTGAGTSEIVFGDAGIGMSLSGMSSGDDNDGGDKESAKKNTGKAAKGQAKAIANRSPNPKAQAQQQNANKRGFRALRMGMNNSGGMFFNHGLIKRNNTMNNNSSNVARRTQMRVRRGR